MVRCKKVLKEIFDRTIGSNMDTKWDSSPSTSSRFDKTYSTNLSKSNDLRRKVHHCHLSYLNMEDTPAKIDYRMKLEDFVTEMLSNVSHKMKFECLDVCDSLSRSITELGENFCAHKASIAYETLEKYAINILSQPWRKEFSVIRTYTGFFQRTVERELVGVRYILQTMGYVEECDKVLRLNSPIDPDKLAKIALDCLVASVECQIMLKVQNIILDSGLDCSFQEILAVRRRFACGVDSTVNILQEAKIKLANNIDKSGRQRPMVNGETSLPQNKGNLHSFANGLKPDSDICESFDLMHFPINAYHSPTSPNYPNVTNSRFAYNNNSSMGYIAPPDMFANHGTQPMSNFTQTTSKLNKQQNGLLNDSLQKIGREASARNMITPIDLKSNGMLQNGTTSSYPKSSNLHILQKRENSATASALSHGAVYDTSSRKPSYSEREAFLSQQNGTPLQIKSSYVTSPVNGEQQAVCVDEVDGARSLKQSIRKWSCPSCTYLNNYDIDVCVMCSKSRLKPTEQPLVSGGKECSSCTLVNHRDRQFCSACSTSLSDSPTYI